MKMKTSKGGTMANLPSFCFQPFDVDTRVRVDTGGGRWFDHANCKWVDDPVIGRLEAIVGPIVHVRTDSGRLFIGAPFALSKGG